MKKIAQNIINQKIEFDLSLDNADPEKRYHYQDIWEDFKDFEISLTVSFEYTVSILRGGFMEEDDVTIKLINVDLESMSVYCNKIEDEVELNAEEKKSIFESFKFYL